MICEHCGAFSPSVTADEVVEAARQARADGTIVDVVTPYGTVTFVKHPLLEARYPDGTDQDPRPGELLDDLVENPPVGCHSWIDHEGRDDFETGLWEDFETEP